MTNGHGDRIRGMTGLLIANVIGLAGIGLFWPSAGWHLSTLADTHVRRTILVAALSGLALVLSVAAQRISERTSDCWLVLGSLEIVQIVRFWAAIRAMDHWPGGDDGPGLGWLIFSCRTCCCSPWSAGLSSSGI